MRLPHRSITDRVTLLRFFLNCNRAKARPGSRQSDRDAPHDGASARGAVQPDDGVGGGLRGPPQRDGEAGDAALGQDDGRGELHGAGPRGQSQAEELSERQR